MSDEQACENAIMQFVSDFMDIKVVDRGESLAYRLSSLQQLELLLFVQAQYGVDLPASLFADAGNLTPSRLAELVRDAKQA